MSGVWWGLATILALVVLVIGKVTLDLVNKEVQGWLAEVPLCVLRLARRRLPAELRDELYDQLGLEAELETILHHTYAKKPITALIKGSRFAAGHVIGLRRCARIVGTPSVVMKLKGMLFRKRTRTSEQKEPQSEDYMNLIRSRLTEQYGSERVAAANGNRGARVTILMEGPKELDIVDMIFQNGKETHMIQVKESWIQSGENRDPAE